MPESKSPPRSGGSASEKPAAKAKLPAARDMIPLLKEAIETQYPKGAERARALIAADTVLAELEGGTPGA